MRRIFILLLLFAGMQLILPLGEQGQGSQALLAFGFLILAAYTVGEIASAVRLPKIVGYLFAGVIFGPHLLQTITIPGVHRLTPVSQLAIALIAFLAGAELKWAEVRERGVLLLKITVVELAFAFVAIGGLLIALRQWNPVLANETLAGAIAFAVLFAAIAIVHSPAVTMALLSETGARGPVARTTLGVVLISDVIVMLLFSASLALARMLVPPSGGGELSVGLVAWEIVGALIIGALLGAGVAYYLRFVGRELFLFAILIAFFGGEIARMAHVEVLLTMLAAGFVAENTSPHGDELRHAVERSAAPIFVVFFALAGTQIDIEALTPLLPLIAPLAIVRALAIWAGTNVGGRWAGASADERKYVWMGLVPQVGVAIGLATIVSEAYPERGAAMSALLLALIAVNQIIGPILARRALDRSGETAATPAPAAEPVAPGPAPTA